MLIVLVGSNGSSQEGKFSMESEQAILATLAQLPPCTACNGEGVQIISTNVASRNREDHEIFCGACQGTGKEGGDRLVPWA